MNSEICEAGSAYAGSASCTESIDSKVLRRERGFDQKRSAKLVVIEIEVWGYKEHKNEPGRAPLKGI